MTYAFIVDSLLFTKATRDGLTSLGGSESACLGLARALKTRGHDVHIFTTQIAPDAIGLDAAGCAWHPIADFHPMNQFIEWDVVVALRWFAFFGQSPVHARLRLLWNQDLLVPGAMAAGVMSIAWAFDRLVYVSDYHRAQWEDLEPCLTGHGYVTRNGFDPRDLPKAATKDPNRLIHISRPERGLKPLLELWPKLRAQKPDATLRLCRYASMYDDGEWGQVCRSYDDAVKVVNAEVGGIEYLGELTKPQLYQAISEAAVMWYPGVSTFAETSCIAATEANACGTPFVGSLKGALAETARPSYDGGLLMPGRAERDEAYGDLAIAKVLELMDGCQRQSFQYRALQRAGKKHAEAYTYDVLAAEWDQWIESTFNARYAAHTVGILRQLLHEDDHVAAQLVAKDIIGQDNRATANGLATVHGDQALGEALTARDFCTYVIAGKDHTADQYGDAAIDPLKEVEISDRFRAVIPQFDKCTRVLDIACGNGSFAIGLALANPNVHVYGLDFSEANVVRATEGATRAGVADRCTFERVTVYDFDTQAMHADYVAWVLDPTHRRARIFDGLFVGEFVEHVAACTLLIDELERVLTPGAKVVYTCPSGACAEIFPKWQTLHRGHVHRFHFDDVKAVWGPKQDFSADYLASGTTERGNPLGNWLISYTVAPKRPAGSRPLASRIQRTRPMPKLSVGIIAKNAELDLARCLTTVWPIADELIIGDTGSTDQTKAIAAQYKARVIDVTSVQAQPEGFAGARNAVLQACTGDWFLWIDTDEQLVDGFWLRRYLDGAIYNGFVLQQTHLYLDGPPTHDIPVRVFRTGRDVRFFGCIHEQPQQGDANTDIFPTLEPYDVKIAHTGYLTERIRSEKRVSRNLPLLVKDAQVFPERVLGHVLRIREAVIQADEICASAGGLTDKARQGYQIAVQAFIQHFDDPTHKYHKLSRPWYEAALRHLGLGYEFEVGMAGKHGPLGETRARPERLWVRDADELQRILAWKTAAMQQSMASLTFKTDPFVYPESPHGQEDRHQEEEIVEVVRHQDAFGRRPSRAAVGAARA